MRSDDARRLLARGQRQPADRLRLPDRRPRPRARDDLRRPDQERLRALPARRASCASTAAGPAATSGRRSRRACRSSDCYVNVLRDAMAVDSLDPCGVYFGTTGGQVYASADAGDTLGADRARPAGRALGRGADAAMIRVVAAAAPADPRAASSGEVRARASTGPVTQRAVLDALEARYHAARHDPRPRHEDAARSSASSPAERTSPTSRPTPRCPRRSPPAASPSSCSARSRAARSATRAGEGEPMKFMLLIRRPPR